MGENKAIYGKYFCGNKISPYGLKNHRVDYSTFAKAFDAVLANKVISFDVCGWEQISGSKQDDVEIFQWFVVSASGADIIKYFTDDPVFYNKNMDLYVWGVTHFGTSWDYVLTDIKIKEDDE